MVPPPPCRCRPPRVVRVGPHALRREREGLAQMSDSGELEAIIERAMADNPDAVEKIREGNGKAIGDNFLEQGDHARIMGMNLFEPPNVAGWPGGLDWINSGTLLARAEFAKELASADSGGNRLKLSNITGLPLGQSAADPGDVIDAILAQLGLDQGPIAITPSSAQRTALINYATTDSPTLDLSNDSTDDANTKVRGLVSLALEAAEHNTF